MAQHADRPPLYCKHFISVSRAQTIKGALHNKPQQQLHSCCTSRCTLLLKVHIGLRLRNGFMVRPTPQACRPRQQPALAALSGKHSRGILDLIWHWPILCCLQNLTWPLLLAEPDLPWPIFCCLQNLAWPLLFAKSDLTLTLALFLLFAKHASSTSKHIIKCMVCLPWIWRPAQWCRVGEHGGVGQASRVAQDTQTQWRW